MLFSLSSFSFHSFLRLQAIGRYLKSEIEKDSSKEAESSKPIKLKQKYSLRDVVSNIYRDRIEEEIPFKPTDKGYIGCYQRALTNTIKSLSREELEEAQTTLAAWDGTGPPAHVQLKWVLNILTFCEYDHLQPSQKGQNKIARWNSKTTQGMEIRKWCFGHVSCRLFGWERRSGFSVSVLYNSFNQPLMLS